MSGLTTEQLDALESGATPSGSLSAEQVKPAKGMTTEELDAIDAHHAAQGVAVADANAAERGRQALSGEVDENGMPIRPSFSYSQLGTDINNKLGPDKPPEVNPRIAASFDQGPINPLQVANSELKAQQVYYGESHGAMSHVGHVLTIPGQAVARGVIEIANATGKLPEQDAKNLLSQGDVSTHDLLDFYWRDPKSLSERTMRFLSGFALDIVTDPLMLIGGPGAISKAGKEVQVAGKTIANLDKMSTAERFHLRGAEVIDKIITGQNEVIPAVAAIEPELTAGKTAAEVTAMTEAKASEMIKQNIDSMEKFTGKKISLTELNNNLQGVPDSIKQDIVSAYTKTQNAGYFDEMAAGQRGLTIGFKIPFTNIAKEADLPFTSSATKATGRIMQSFFNWAGDTAAVNNKIVQTVAAAAQGVFSKTGYSQWDEGKNLYLGNRSGTAQWAQAFEKRGKQLVSNTNGGAELAELGSDVSKSTAQSAPKGATEAHVVDINKEVQTRVDNPDQVLEAFGKEKWQKDPNGNILKDADGNPVPTWEHQKLLPTEEDIARRQRMPPSHLQFAQESIDELDKIKSEFAKRPGIPFDELDPFGPGWANRYLPHKLSAEYKLMLKGTHAPEQVAIQTLERTKGGVYASSSGRKYRGLIEDANDVSQQAFKITDKKGVEHGIKILADNPVELVSQAVQDAKRVIRNYDLMETAIPHSVLVNPGEEIPNGFVKFDLNHFQNTALKVQNTEKKAVAAQKIELSLKEGASKEAAVQRATEDVNLGKQTYRVFVPPYFKENRNIYLPATVYNDMRQTINPSLPTGFKGVLLDGIDKFSQVFKNSALLGLGYTGMKTLADVTTSLSAGYTDYLSSGKQALELMTPNWVSSAEKIYQFKTPAGEAYNLTKEELWNLAVKHNVMGTGFTQDMSMVDLAENIASTRTARENMGRKLMTFADHALLWREQRWVIQNLDDVQKAALFIDRMKDGFSPAAAAESVERFFYSFNNSGPSARNVKRLMPFAAFPIKTMERLGQQLKDGHVGSLTIPDKVSTVIQGAFVPDADVRNTLNEMIPEYNKLAYDRVHGLLLPGQREVLSQIHWSAGTVGFFLEPGNDLHPLIQMLGISLTSRDSLDYNNITQAEDIKKRTWEMAQRAIPAWIRDPMAIADINSNLFGGIFADKYKETFVDSATKNQKWENAYLFGKFMEDNKTQNALYNLVFSGDVQREPDKEVNGKLVKGSETPYGMMQLVERGNFLKQHFRDLTLGIATMTDMDKNFFINNGAITKEMQDLKKSITKDQAAIGFLPNLKLMTDKDIQKEAAKDDPKLKRLIELELHQEVLNAYYGFYVGMQKKYPRLDWTGMLFGAGQYNMNWKELDGIKSNINKIDKNKIDMKAYLNDLMTKESEKNNQTEEPEKSVPSEGESNE